MIWKHVTLPDVLRVEKQCQEVGILVCKGAQRNFVRSYQI